MPIADANTPTPLPMIAVCLPGGSFSAQWLIHWNSFFHQFLQHYTMLPCYASGCNLYEVRNRCIPQFDRLPPDRPCDYLLWIDSDNLVTWAGFQFLMHAIQDPKVSAVGGWYWHQDVLGDEPPKVAGGSFDGRQKDGARLAEIEAAAAAGALLEVDYLGFGFLLMKAQIIHDLGATPFFPLLVQNEEGMGFMGDDVGFCYMAKSKGHRFFIHPWVQVPHLKLRPIVHDGARVEILDANVVAEGQPVAACILDEQSAKVLQEVS